MLSCDVPEVNLMLVAVTQRHMCSYIASPAKSKII